MRLKRVKLFGFKTFADRTELNVDGGIVAVVGPNGCGKSNLVDAILWGLGEGSARQLRAATGQDVIFNGSSQRKPVGFAEVSLLFDNDDGALPIDTPEVQVTRRLNRSGESEYLINRQPCRLRDIYDLFADSGLGRAGYAIVGQKDIDQALAASADDRRAWIDEAAGVQRYRARKVESQRRLANAQQHLERVADIVRELDAQREPLREEAELARRYKQIQGSLQEIEVALLAREAVTARIEAEAQAARVAESMRLGKEELARAEALEAEIRKAGEAIGLLESDMDALRALQQGSLTAMERAEAELRLAQQRLETLDASEQALDQEAEVLRERIREAAEDLAGHEAEEKAERDALAALQTEYAGAEDEAKRLAAQLAGLEKELEAARAAHAEALKRQAEEAHRRDRLKLARRELAGIEASVPDLDAAIGDAETAYDEAHAAVLAAEIAAKEADAKVSALRKEDDQDAAAVRQKMAERASLEGRRRGIESTLEQHEGLAQGARAVMEAAERGLLKGSYVPVGEAVEADREVALAIETALGGAANDLIVDDDRDAKAAIEFLKQHRAGRATFQPIPLMRPDSAGPDLRRLLGERGVLGRASELVRCEARVRPVIESLLGRVVIVETLDDALKLAKSGGWNRLVTLDGEVVHHRGAVSGGVSQRQTYGLVQRKADLAELEHQIADLERELSRAQKATDARKRQEEQLRVTASEHRQEAETRRPEAEEARAFLQTLKDERLQAVRAKERLEREIAQLEAPAADGPEKAVDVPALEAQRDRVLKELAARSSDSEQAETRLREAEGRVQQSSSRTAAAQRRHLAALEAEQHRGKRIANLGPERERLRGEIGHHEAERAKALERKQDADRRLEVAIGQRRELLEKSLAMTEDAKTARTNAQSVGDAAHQAELNRARAENRRTIASQRLLEEYGLTEDEAAAQEHGELPEDAAQLVSRLRRELKSMGDVNLGAVEAFERLTQRFEELDAQQQDLLESIRDIERSISELDKLTRERFLTTFAAVQQAFTELFARLFPGGSGAISLSDGANVLDSGVDIEVQLPGKKKQPLSLLSGGERALCGAAFLFALLKVKPSPLVVLDELDAPLDGRNVERFAELVREFTDRTQFVVITHNPTTMAASPVLVGVTMQEPGVSMLVPVRLPEDSAEGRSVSALN